MHRKQSLNNKFNDCLTLVCYRVKMDFWKFFSQTVTHTTLFFPYRIRSKFHPWESPAACSAHINYPQTEVRFLKTIGKLFEDMQSPYNLELLSLLFLFSYITCEYFLRSFSSLIRGNLCCFFHKRPCRNLSYLNSIIYYLIPGVLWQDSAAVILFTDINHRKIFEIITNP